MIGQMANVIAFPSFNDLGRTVTPTFLSRNRFYLQLSLHCPKMNKKSMWEVKKILRFLSTRHRILPSCGCKARDIVVAKCELVLQGTSPYSVKKPDFSDLGCSSRHVISKTKSVTPHFFYISDITNSSTFNGKILRKKINVRKFSRERP